MTSSVIYYSTDARKNEIYLLNITFIQYNTTVLPIFLVVFGCNCGNNNYCGGVTFAASDDTSVNGSISKMRIIMVILDMLVWYSMITGIIGIITVKIMIGMVIVIVRYEYRDNRHNNNWNHGIIGMIIMIMAMIVGIMGIIIMPVSLEISMV